MVERHISIINQRFQDVNPLICGWQACPRGHGYGPASREYYLVHYVLSGKGVFCREQQRKKLAAGDLFLIRPEELTYYEADKETPWYYIWIGFDGAGCRSLLEQSLFGSRQDVVHLPEAEALFLQIQNEFNHQTGSELFLCAKIYELLALLQPKQGPEKRTDEYVQRAVDYMKGNYASQIRVDQLAHIIGIDRHYLSRIFKQKMGVSPKHYLLELRLNRAAVYLVQRDYPVKAAAYSVGYNDVFNFSKVFKQYYGLSPRAYKEKHRRIKME